ncbi:hypothetical protein PG999_007644 [Apiospora kogelbergensis]|uniref:Uncharacterized protein n=1 Tax=Apiospora kogelbergensis TaxID=1337665 RepID=A0AAW0QLJ6_9PEZI
MKKETVLAPILTRRLLPFIDNSGGNTNSASGGVKQVSTTAVNIKRVCLCFSPGRPSISAATARRSNTI